MDPAIIVACISGVVAFTSIVFTYRSSIKATKVDEKKVDQEAYERAMDFSQQQLDYAAKQIDRMTSQIDRLNLQLESVSTQLSKEQDVSNAFRNQVRVLHSQVDILTGTIEDLRIRLGERLGKDKEAVTGTKDMISRMNGE
jgi:peptidoglycan hydrolase CwlO-like protein